MTMLPPDPKFVIIHKSSIACLTFSANQSSLYSGCLNGEVIMWSLQTFRAISSFSCGPESVLSIHNVERAEGEEDLLVQDKMGAISRWTKDNGTWAKTWNFKINYMGFCQCRVMDDTLVSPVSSGGLQFNSVHTGEKISTMSLMAKEVAGELMSILPFTRNSEKFVLTGTERGDVCIWNWEGCSCGSSLRLEDCVMTLAFDPNRMRGAAAGPTGTITTFNITPGGIVASRLVKLPLKGVASIVLRPDTKILAAGCWNGKLKLFSWKSLVCLATLSSHDESIQTVAFSNKSPFLLAAGCKDGMISIWDLYNSR